MKKMGWVAGIVCVLALLLVICTYRMPIIGTVGGTEWEILTIENETYERVEDAPVSSADRGRLLGIAANGDTRFWIYAIREKKEFLYCRWDWEGWIYRRIQ